MCILLPILLSGEMVACRPSCPLLVRHSFVLCPLKVCWRVSFCDSFYHPLPHSLHANVDQNTPASDLLTSQLHQGP